MILGRRVSDLRPHAGGCRRGGSAGSSGRPARRRGRVPLSPVPSFAWWQLEEKAELNAHVKVLPFQREDRDVEADTLCEAAGWGTVTHSGRRPDKLQQVERPVISRELCNHRTRHDQTITEKMMCTDSRKKDTCKVPACSASCPRPRAVGWG